MNVRPMQVLMHGRRRIEGYAELLPELAALDPVCAR